MTVKLALPAIAIVIVSIVLLLRKRKPMRQVGIGLDEPIEVSPGVFRTARQMTSKASNDESYLQIEASKNPELANILETHFGWKDGHPGEVPVAKQIVDRAVAESESYIDTATGHEPFEPSYQEGRSSAVKLAISKHSVVVLAPSQAVQNRALLVRFIEAKEHDDQLTMAKIYCALRDFDYGR